MFCSLSFPSESPKQELIPSVRIEAAALMLLSGGNLLHPLDRWWRRNWFSAAAALRLSISAAARHRNRRFAKCGSFLEQPRWRRVIRSTKQRKASSANQAVEATYRAEEWRRPFMKLQRFERNILVTQI